MTAVGYADLLEFDDNGIPIGPQILETGITNFGQSAQISNSCSIHKETITQISCGHDHSAILCESGRVYTFGKNKFQQLGLKNAGDRVSEPTLVNRLKAFPIVQVACGCHFTYFLSASGKLFSCGRNHRGQLGQGQKSEKNCSVPSQTTTFLGLSTFKKVVAGMCHAVALTDSGCVFACGSGLQGQTGIGNQTFCADLVHLSIPLPIVDVGCGAFHTVLLALTGEVFVVGCNDKGQLGLDTYRPSVRHISVVSLPSAVNAIACGSSHTLALARDGTVWVWGSNVFGQQGTGGDENNHVPTRVAGLDGYTIAKIYAGANTTALVTDDGELLVCGCGQQGQLGYLMDDIRMPTLLGKKPDLTVRQVACASTYTLVLARPRDF